MKIMIAGDWHSVIHEEAITNALESLGHVIIRFPWFQYFSVAEGTHFARVKRTCARLQNKAIAGPQVARLNEDLVEKALSQRPDVLFVYRGTHILPDSLRAIRARQPHTLLVGYNNDDPFSQRGSRLLWRHFLRTIPLYDLILAYRLQNIEDFRRAGAKRVELLRSWFVEKTPTPASLSAEERDRFECDVVFAGHYENDGRAEMLDALVAEGFKLRLFGPTREWDSAVQRSPRLRGLAPVVPVWGDMYDKAIIGAKVALCFLSKLNRDTYTRRVFEITALRSLLMSEYTDDLATLFEEDKEAVFFRTKDELVEKVRRYVHDDHGRRQIAERGYQRAHHDGHDVVSRMRTLVRWIDELRSAGIAG
jgi:spore maturation protein CgeB